ncbi:MAG: hypothetical protein AABX96_04735 [Nanoarchaeota archaeon]
MSTITLSVPEDLKDKMNQLDTINWSAVARHAFIEQLKELERNNLLKRFKKIVSKSKLTEADADELSEKIKTSMTS